MSGVGVGVGVGLTLHKSGEAFSPDDVAGLKIWVKADGNLTKDMSDKEDL